MMKKNLLKLTSFISLGIFYPVVAFALTYTPPANVCILKNSPKFQDILYYVNYCILEKYVIPLIFTLAIVTFVWGVVQFVINSDEEAKKAKGKQFMIWGIIALTVMISVWGLVAILGNTFNIETSVLPRVSPE